MLQAKHGQTIDVRFVGAQHSPSLRSFEIKRLFVLIDRLEMERLVGDSGDAAPAASRPGDARDARSRRVGPEQREERGRRSWH